MKKTNSLGFFYTIYVPGGGSYKGSSRSYRKQRLSNYSKRNRKLQAKKEMLHNISSFAEELYQKQLMVFKGNGFKKGKSKKKGQLAWNTRFQFFVDNNDYEVETIYKSTVDGNNYCYYSCTNDEPHWRDLSGCFNNHRFYWSWGRQDKKEDKSSSESDRLELDMTSDRLALGLDSSGPLSLADVKNAYRVSTLKWHPDRHHGPHKVVAEEKFKLCSAAYQSLCDKLSLN